MRDEQRLKRHKVITEAAYELLTTKGYDGTSMLSISKAAKASNETLYRWYGDKRGLFEAMVRDNSAAIQAALEQAIARREDPRTVLERIAPVLLEMLLGERAISLNRAAASDPSGELGAAISRGGRHAIQPLIEKLIASVSTGHETDAATCTDWFVGLLIGDLQIKRVIGTMPEPSREEIERRCRSALDAFFRLLDAG